MNQNKKQAVQLRLKRNGMKWKIKKDQGILKLRTMYTQMFLVCPFF